MHARQWESPIVQPALHESGGFHIELTISFLWNNTKFSYSHCGRIPTPLLSSIFCFRYKKSSRRFIFLQRYRLYPAYLRIHPCFYFLSNINMVVRKYYLSSRQQGSYIFWEHIYLLPLVTSLICLSANTLYTYKKKVGLSKLPRLMQEDKWQAFKLQFWISSEWMLSFVRRLQNCLRGGAWFVALIESAHQYRSPQSNKVFPDENWFGIDETQKWQSPSPASSISLHQVYQKEVHTHTSCGGKINLPANRKCAGKRKKVQ